MFAKQNTDENSTAGSIRPFKTNYLRMKKRFVLFTVLIFSMCGLSAKQWVYVSPKG